MSIDLCNYPSWNWKIVAKEDKEFEKLIDSLLEDGLLQKKDWESLVYLATAGHKLPREEAERRFLRKAFQVEAPIELLELKRLEDLVKIATVGGVIDGAAHALILEENSRVSKIFETPRSEAEIRKRVWNQQARGQDEDRLKQQIEERLVGRAHSAKVLGKEEWRQFYLKTLDALLLDRKCGDDFVDLFLAVRKTLGISIQETELIVGVPPPPVAIDPGGPTPPLGDGVEPEQSKLTPILNGVMIVAVVATIVYLSLRYFVGTGP